MHKSRLARLAIAATLTLGVGTAIAGCATQNDTLAESYSSAGGAGYTSRDGTVVTIAEDQRGDPVEFSGITERDEPVSSADYADRVYVVNFWYAACGPCRVEAPMLEEVWQKHQPDDVGFLGVNTYDQAGTALSFAEGYGITYPSVIDVNDGNVKLAFAAVTPIQATPTTLVIDQEGRVAARIIGQLESPSILSALVQDTLDENP